MNNIILMGRLTSDPEIKTSTSGKTFATFTLAVDRKAKEKKTDFFPCVAFDKTADNIERFFSKGNRILIRGSMQSDQYEKDGKKYPSWKLVVSEFDFTESKDTKPETPSAPADMPDDDFPF